MQIKITRDGLWHRRQHGNGEDHTACGLTIGVAYLSRDPILDTSLCPECFTPRERDTGEMKRIEREAIERSKAEGFSDKEEPTDEHDPLPVTSPFAREKPDGDDGSR